MTEFTRREMLLAFASLPALSGLASNALAAAAPGDLLPYRDGKYVLPALPYDYNALEPSIDEQTMKLHHDKHHLGYVNGLNKALDALADARSKNDFALVKHWERELAFNGSGHFLHCIFWLSMGPSGGGDPSGNFAQALTREFGSVTGFRAHFSAAAKAVEGSGWAILAYEPLAKKLMVSMAEKHQNLTEWGVIPILALDVWEHAYYLKYQNDRAAYVDNWWKVVNWNFAQDRFSLLDSLANEAEKRISGQ